MQKYFHSHVVFLHQVGDRLSPNKLDTSHEWHFMILEIDSCPIAEPARPVYIWMQTEEDISVTFVVSEEITKSDVLFKLSADNLEVGLKNSHVLLKGLLHARVDVESSTWTLSDRQYVYMAI